MEQINKFNTGNQYDHNGQLILWEIVETWGDDVFEEQLSTIHVLDLSRGMNIQLDCVPTKDINNGLIMAMYNKGDYSYLTTYKMSDELKAASIKNGYPNF